MRTKYMLCRCPRGCCKGFPFCEHPSLLLYKCMTLFVGCCRLLWCCGVKGERGKKVQELLFDELWRETKRQMRSIQVKQHLFKADRLVHNTAGSNTAVPNTAIPITAVSNTAVSNTAVSGTTFARIRPVTRPVRPSSTRLLDNAIFDLTARCTWPSCQPAVLIACVPYALQMFTHVPSLAPVNVLIAFHQVGNLVPYGRLRIKDHRILFMPPSYHRECLSFRSRHYLGDLTTGNGNATRVMILFDLFLHTIRP